MRFDSPAYLLFLPAVALVHWLCPHRARWAVLLAASLVFYMGWNVPLTGLLALTVLLTWGACLLLERARSRGLRRLLSGLTLAACLGLLGWFKYGELLFSLADRVLRGLGGGGLPHPGEILLPVGISFYTFQALSCVLDVSRGRRRAERHLGYYALYICFFPQLVAGPIERADALLPQLRAQRAWDPEHLRRGGRLLLSGYFRKLVVADLCGPVVARVCAASAPEGSAVALATLLFAFQIYGDFAGYSEIAQGSARLLGIRLMRNFDRPYTAGSLREFWRRWHISLGRWFTDYVYIPLGGSRKGKLRQAAAVLLVFALSGLWHGADLRFLVWGLVHGLGVALEVLLTGKNGAGRGRGGRLRQAAVFLFVWLTWVLFRAGSLPGAAALYGALFSPWRPAEGLLLLGIGAAEALCLGLALLQEPFLNRLAYGENGEDPVPDVRLVLCGAAVVWAWLIRLGSGAGSAFIYFQF